MITDKQGREWLLQKLYDGGWQYYVKDNYGNVFLTDEKPFVYDKVSVRSCKKNICVPTCVFSILPELKNNECISIAEELGIIDWENVAVDTPILVKGLKIAEWKNRYFAFFKDGKVYAWCSGSTSWSCKNNNDVSSWDCAKLAEV